MLRERPHTISETRLYVLNPDYVAREAAEKFIGRAAWRDNFDDIANSIASDHFVYYHKSLRGVRG